MPSFLKPLLHAPLLANADCRNPRGFFQTNFRVNFAGDFLVDFRGPFSLEKQDEKSTPKSIAKFKSSFGSSAILCCIDNIEASKPTTLKGMSDPQQLPRGQKIKASFFCTKFFKTASGHGRPRRNRGRLHQKLRFPAAPVVGRNFLTPGHSGVRVRNVRGKSGPKSLCLCCFSSLTLIPLRARYVIRLGHAQDTEDYIYQK